MSKKVIQCRVSVTADAVVLSAEHEPDIRFEFPVGGMPEIANHDFAVWALAPIAMLKNVDLKIEGRVSERAIASAELITDIWEKWRPAIFHRVRITADDTFTEQAATERRLSFFSGGIDSTYSALRSFNEQGLKTDFLSLHGMDYRYEDQQNFDKLMAQTAPFRDAYFEKAHVVRTTLGHLFFRHYYIDEVANSYSTYMMIACASLYDGYSEYRIASDNRLEQQYWSFPFGNFTSLNRLIKSANAGLETIYDDAVRSEKVKYLNESGVDLSTLSICPDKSIQPGNCGVCGKCMRTKVMFLAATGDVPDIFINRSVGEDWIDHVDLSNVLQASYMMDMLSLIENEGDPKVFPGYAAAWRRYVDQCEKNLNPTFYTTSWKENIRYLTPKPLYDAARKVRGLIK